MRRPILRIFDGGVRVGDANTLTRGLASGIVC
ncbi:hypothetical protein BH23CHL5_BH23CHL5_00960 [soil metagenome]